MKLFKMFSKKSEPDQAPVEPVQAHRQADYAAISGGYAPAVNHNHTGDKFAGGFGTTKLFTPDYWTLRQRSAQLFTENLYARGLIRRLITNEINTGLTPEASPDESIIGLPEDALTDWSEDVENRFALWGKNPKVCDWKQKNTFGAIQREARMEALIEGDILVVLRQSQLTRLPQVQLVKGGRVRSPLSDTTIKKGHTIKHGVECDALGREVAYWTLQDDNTFKRLPAYGAKSGRRLAWLVYGTDKRMDDVRGEPMLSLIMQSVKDIDSYRDSTQRKAVINSLFAAQVTKSEDKPGTLPLTGGAVHRSRVTTTDDDGSPRQLNISEYIPGIVVDELQTGEKIEMMGGQGTDVNFSTFEAAIIHAMAWANEVPPEILTLAFAKSFSASQSAINEFKIYLNKVWSSWGESFCTPIYDDWLISEVLQQKIAAPGLLEAWRDPQQQDVLGAWVSADWYGSIKPTTDTLKQVRGSDLLVAGGYSTRARESRLTTGTKYSKNIKRLRRENEQLAEALRPMLEMKSEFSMEATAQAVSALDNADEIESILDDYLNAG